jgi:hypothetical protein
VLLGVIGVAVRLDAPGDGTVVSFWQVDGVIIEVPDPAESPELHTGDLVTVIAGHRLADGLGGLPGPVPGDQLSYDIVRNAAPVQVPVGIDHVDPYPLLLAGWGNLIFVVALAALAGALYFRRPEEPATTPLLINAAALFGSRSRVGHRWAAVVAVQPEHHWLVHDRLGGSARLRPGNDA